MTANVTRLKIELEAHAELLRALTDANARERVLVEEIDRWRTYARSLEQELGRGQLTGVAAVPVPSPRTPKSWSLSDIIDETFERETTEPKEGG